MYFTAYDIDNIIIDARVVQVGNNEIGSEKPEGGK